MLLLLTLIYRLILSEYALASMMTPLEFATSADCAKILSMKRQRFIWLWIPLGLLLAVLLPGRVAGPVRAQDPARDLLRLINSARLDQGLYPYVVNAQLTAAAQRHSDDMAVTGQIDHTGSDGSSSTQRVLEAGYGAYPFGPLVSENIFGGSGGAEIPFNTWLEQAGARSNLLHEKYRELGIGVASDAQGQTFWTLNVGAQPNVLPVLINDDTASVDTVTVTLRLLPENVVPDGVGTAMGQPVEYRASTSVQFTGTEWSPWVEQVPFVLDETPGQQTVYVQLRDAADRTTVSQDSVVLTGLETIVTPTVPLVTATPGTPAATSTTSGTSTPTSPASPTPTRTPTTSPTPAATETTTLTPTPTASPTPDPTATATYLPTGTPPPVETVTSSPPPLPTRGMPPTPPTPTRPMPAEVEIEEESEPPSLASRLVPWAVGLQVVALILGVYVALRRPSE
jgi:uncharacterized protein YkwD